MISQDSRKPKRAISVKIPARNIQKLPGFANRVWYACCTNSKLQFVQNNKIAINYWIFDESATYEISTHLNQNYFATSLFKFRVMANIMLQKLFSQILTLLFKQTVTIVLCLLTAHTPSTVLGQSWLLKGQVSSI